MNGRFLVLTALLGILIIGCKKESDPDNPGPAGKTCDFEWVKQAGGTNTDYGHCITSDGQGNVYVSGSFTGTATFGSFTLKSDGNNNIFITKMDANGEFKWAKSCGGNSLFTDQERMNSMALDLEGNVYVCGTFSDTGYFDTTALYTTNNDIFIAKLNSKGDFVWARQAGGPGNGDFATSISVDNLGGIFLSGSFYHEAWFGDISLKGSAPGSYTYLARMSNTGQFSWAKLIAENTVVSIRSVAADALGNAYFTGFFNNSATLGTFPLNAINQFSDIYVAKVTAAGIYEWVQTAQGINYDVAEAICVDKQQNIYITGTFVDSISFGQDKLLTSGKDAFIAKMNSSGDWLWAKQGKTVKTIPENLSIGISLSTDDIGNVFTTGYLMGTTIFGSDTIVSNGHTNAFMIKLDSQGNFIWINHSTSKGNSGGSCIVPDNQGSCYVTGYFSNLTTFGEYTLPWSGSTDIFVAKMKENNN
jgi:hypothetical protein